jgi:hypothetical protein
MLLLAVVVTRKRYKRRRSSPILGHGIVLVKKA